MPSDDQLAELERLATELNARILMWEAQPPQEAIELVEGFGLQSIVFETWADQGAEGNFVDAYENAVSRLSEAASQNID